jgi:hypothetical protein
MATLEDLDKNIAHSKSLVQVLIDENAKRLELETWVSQQWPEVAGHLGKAGNKIKEIKERMAK